MTEHHRFLLRQLYDHLRFTESKLSEIEQEIDRRVRPFQDAVIRLCTIPGVDRVTAWALLAEIGLNMDQFPSAAHLASWACLCPGSFESAGKRLSGKMRKGNVSLRRCLSQAAWAISMTKNNYLVALYRRLAARRGAKRAIMAVAHALLLIAHQSAMNLALADGGRLDTTQPGGAIIPDFAKKYPARPRAAIARRIPSIAPTPPSRNDSPSKSSQV